MIFQLSLYSSPDNCNIFTPDKAKPALILPIVWLASTLLLDLILFWPALVSLHVGLQGKV